MLDRTYTDDITPEQDGSETTVAGHVHDLRDLGGLVFVILRDRMGRLQIVLKEDTTPELFARATDLNREDGIQVRGTVSKTAQAPGGRELVPTGFRVISEAETPLPLAIEGSADRSTRLDRRSIDLRTPGTRAVFTLRSRAMTAMREWFVGERFEEVDTPALSAAGAEGGADLFPVVYYDREAFLSQSPQLYKQMLVAAGFDRLFEIGHAFRAENFSTSRHVSEIAMFDVELGYIEDHHDVMDVQEESLRYTLEQLEETATRELDLLDISLDVPTEDFPRITFEEALTLLHDEYEYIPTDSTDLDAQGERLLGEYFEKQGHPMVFVVGYPEEKFYYRRSESDALASRKFDLLYRGLELSSGGQREHDIDRLLAMMDEQDVDPTDFEFYLEAFRYGMPPHGGYGMGIDRLIQQMADLNNIKEAILFPRDPDRLTP